MSALRRFWQNYKVLIVMVPGLGFIHWGWYNIKSSPLFHQNRDQYVPEPGIVTYVAPGPPALPPLPERPSKKKKKKEEANE